MKRIIKLTESDLTRIVERVISEETYGNDDQMFDMEMRRIKRELHNIKTFSDDPERLNHTIDMIINVSLPRLNEFR